jgi:iron complex transport system substrate-binding protein
MTPSPMSRRAFLGTGAVAALALAGCGGGSSSSSTAAGGSTSAEAGTRTVKTPMGVITVPAEPARVVSVHPFTVDALYDYGIEPIGVYDIGYPKEISPRYRSRWLRATKIGYDGEFDLKKIAELDPDLIVGADYEWVTADYGKLSKIAPTVIAPSGEWEEAAQTIATAVGRLEKMEAMRKEMEARSGKIRSSFAKTLGAYRWDLLQGGGEGGEYLLYGPRSGPGGVLTAAGVKLASGSASVSGGEDEALSIFGVTDGVEGITNKAEIAAPLEGADVIGFYSTYEGAPKNEKLLFEQPEFEEIPAAKTGRLVPLPDFLPQGYGDAIALLEQLEEGLKSIA